jgi:SAM-dependent methyltransferase
MEIRVDFNSEEAWREWHANNEKHFQHWREAIVQGVEATGIIEPITERFIPAGQVTIQIDNLRESLSANELNSRKRALLVEVDMLRRKFPRVSARSARIFAAEALTRTALILRGLYPFFLGTEYLPDPDKRRAYLPISHADLLNLDFPDETFDVVLTGDVLEHVPDLPRAMREMARVLKPKGFLLSTFPFLPQHYETARLASLEPTGVKHYVEPQYHGDPVDAKGALVFQIPGWDVLDLCRESGLHDARMVMHCSSVYGIVSNDVPGVFVLSARKVPAAEGHPLRVWSWDTPRIKRVVAILGLPRSGTTMLTAIFNAGRNIASIYEPWNANRKAVLSGEINITAQWLLDEAARSNPEAETLVIKETTTDQLYPEQLLRVLEEVPPTVFQRVVILVRNPFHVFLSEVEARSKWWGEADLKAGRETFDIWVVRTLTSLARLLAIAERHDGIVVSYEAIASSPITMVPRLMDALNVPFSLERIQITKYADFSRIRGDRSLAEQPREVSEESITKRDAELEEVKEALRSSAHYSTMVLLSDQIAALQQEGVLVRTNPTHADQLDHLRDFLAQAGTSQ